MTNDELADWIGMNINHCCECEKLRKRIKERDTWIISHMTEWLTKMPIKKRIDFFESVGLAKGMFHID